MVLGGVRRGSWCPSVPPPSEALTLAGAAGKPRQHKQHFTAAVNH